VLKVVRVILILSSLNPWRAAAAKRNTHRAVQIQILATCHWSFGSQLFFKPRNV